MYILSLWVYIQPQTYPAIHGFVHGLHQLPFGIAVTRKNFDDDFLIRTLKTKTSSTITGQYL